MLQRKRDRLENRANCATLLYVPLHAFAASSMPR